MAGRHCYIRFMIIILVVAVLQGLLSQVDASAKLELLMVRYDNPTSRDVDGYHCDSFIGFRTTDCDHVFQFVVDRGDSNDNPRGSSNPYVKHTTHHYQDETTIHFGGDMAGVSNPIITSFSTWPSVGVKFKVWVTDYDTGGNRDEKVDGFVKLLQPTPALNLSVATWSPQLVLHGIRSRYRTSLTMKYRLYCDFNYYTPDCSVSCVPSDTDADGHYTCDPRTGNIVCRQGWEDVSRMCTTFSNDCLNHSCLNGATCIDGARKYTCRCLPGYTGDRCQHIVRCASNPCKHGGICEEQKDGFTCSCPPGFTGATCEDIDECASNPCKHNATCEDQLNGFTCNCPLGFAGATCEDIIKCASNPCENGGTCEEQTGGLMFCICPPGFTGKLCSDVHHSTNSIVNPARTVSPRSSDILFHQSKHESTSSQMWVYVLIGAVCLVLLAAMVLIAFLCARRRKAANTSENHSQITSQTASQSSSTSTLSYATSLPSEAAAAAASFSVGTENVDFQPGRKWSRNEENLKALNSRKDNLNRVENNIYDSIGDVACAYELQSDTKPRDTFSKFSK